MSDNEQENEKEKSQKLLESLAGEQDIDQMIEQSKLFVKTALDCMEPNQPFAPCFVVKTMKNENDKSSFVMFQIGSSFNTPEEKQQLIEKAAQYLVKEKTVPVAVVMIAEAFLSVVDPETADTSNLPSPSEDPNRKEGIVIGASTISRKFSAMTSMLFERVKDGIVYGDFGEVSKQAVPNLIFRFFDVYLRKVQEHIMEEVIGKSFESDETELDISITEDQDDIINGN